MFRCIEISEAKSHRKGISGLDPKGETCRKFLFDIAPQENTMSSDFTGKVWSLSLYRFPFYSKSKFTTHNICDAKMDENFKFSFMQTLERKGRFSLLVISQIKKHSSIVTHLYVF